jgi:hypothetical protein
MLKMGGRSAEGSHEHCFMYSQFPVLMQQTKAPTKASLMFAGTQEKCIACNKTVYPIEKTSVEGLPYHKNCFKCIHGGCTISPSNYAVLEGRLYCKHYYSQLFKETGNYSKFNNTPALKPTASNVISRFTVTNTLHQNKKRVVLNDQNHVNLITCKTNQQYLNRSEKSLLLLDQNAGELPYLLS